MLNEFILSERQRDERADGLNMLPRPGEPESALVPGMAAPAPRLDADWPPLISGQDMPDTSGPGPTAIQSPGRWVYDFDPANGLARATFNGEMNFTASGAGSPMVVSFNGRGGAVVLTLSDVTGAGGATSAQLAGYLPLGGGALTGALSTSALITPSQTIGIAGTNAANNAQAGSVGEFMTATQAVLQNLASGIALNLTSIALTAGDWDVWGTVNFLFAATTVPVTVQSGWNTVSATQPSATSGQTQYMYTPQVAGSQIFTLYTGLGRLSLAAPATVFLVATATFGTSTGQADGVLNARRAR